jgi:hypothetical protein
MSTEFDPVQYNQNISNEPRLSNVEVRRRDGSAIHSLEELALGDGVVLTTLIGQVFANVSRDDESLVADTQHSVYSLEFDAEIGRVISTHGVSKAALAKVQAAPVTPPAARSPTGEDG